MLSVLMVLSIMDWDSPGQVLSLVGNSGNLGGYGTWPEFPKGRKSPAQSGGEKTGQNNSLVDWKQKPASKKFNTHVFQG